MIRILARNHRQGKWSRVNDLLDSSKSGSGNVADQNASKLGEKFERVNLSHADTSDEEGGKSTHPPTPTGTPITHTPNANTILGRGSFCFEVETAACFQIRKRKVFPVGASGKRPRQHNGKQFYSRNIISDSRGSKGWHE